MAVDQYLQIPCFGVCRNPSCFEVQGIPWIIMSGNTDSTKAALDKVDDKWQAWGQHPCRRPCMTSAMHGIIWGVTLKTLKNGGSPKCMVYKRTSYQNWWFKGSLDPQSRKPPEGALIIQFLCARGPCTARKSKFLYTGSHTGQGLAGLQSSGLQGIVGGFRLQDVSSVFSMICILIYN